MVEPVKLYTYCLIVYCWLIVPCVAGKSQKTVRINPLLMNGHVLMFDMVNILFTLFRGSMIPFFCLEKRCILNDQMIRYHPTNLDHATPRGLEDHHVL